ncbi:MAG: V-type ATP synthase subunit D, partial [Candidatus Aureabacteria bacterium]|nr:V-type ATP synthase subunit D [Candidatus Auribacterota bacterium]
MARKKIKFTKGELKKQRDSKTQFQRYLPILQLKQQQLQLEVQKTEARLKKLKEEVEQIKEDMVSWIGVLAEPKIDLTPWVKPKDVVTSTTNIAGVDVPVFKRADFAEVDYDIFSMPLWVDSAVDEIRRLSELIAETDITQEEHNILNRELKVTMQRVNLFEKVKIPESKENIRVIQIYLG